jgi:hypothetical protein
MVQPMLLLEMGFDFGRPDPMMALTADHDL